MDKKCLHGKTALVTGAGRGIGRSIALSLADAGVAVVLASRTAKELDNVASEITGQGGQAVAVPTDISDADAVTRLVRKTMKLSGQIDILVNNAGIGVFGPIEETGPAEWDRVMTVNARGPFLLCREVVASMKKQDGLSFIVNIASVVGVKGYENQTAYSASKHALMGFTKALAREVRDCGIRVHALCPGGVDTEMVTHARPDLDRSVLMTPDDIADIVFFLVTRRGNAVIDEIVVRRAASMPWA